VMEVTTPSGVTVVGVGHRRAGSPAHEHRPPKTAKAGANKGWGSRSPEKTTNIERGDIHHHRCRREAPASATAASVSSRASGVVGQSPAPRRRRPWPPPRRPAASAARIRRRTAQPTPLRPHRVAMRRSRARRARSRGPPLWI
jgi:hypothetical protein